MIIVITVIADRISCVCLVVPAYVPATRFPLPRIGAATFLYLHTSPRLVVSSNASQHQVPYDGTESVFHMNRMIYLTAQRT
jgi:hypothetical protein